MAWHCELRFTYCKIRSRWLTCERLSAIAMARMAMTSKRDPIEIRKIIDPSHFPLVSIRVLLGLREFPRSSDGATCVAAAW